MNRHTRQAKDGVSRRNLLKAVGVCGVAALSAAGSQQASVAQAQAPGDSVETMLNVAITAAALATTLVYGVITQSTYFRRLPAIHAVPPCDQVLDVGLPLEPVPPARSAF